MKKTGLSAVMIGFGLMTACGQHDAPQAVQNAFKAKYPDATSVDWEQEEHGEWEAEFKMNGNEKEAVFDAQGVWKETEREIKRSMLPEAVTASIASEFNGYEAEEVEEVERADGEIVYEVELEKGREEWEVIFSADGKVLSKEKEDGKEEDGE